MLRIYVTKICLRCCNMLRFQHKLCNFVVGFVFKLVHALAYCGISALLRLPMKRIICTHRIIVVCMLMLAAAGVCARSRYGRTEANHYIRLSADFSYARSLAKGGYAWDAEMPMSLREAQSIIGSGMKEAGIAGNGFAPGLGVGYRLTYGYFVFDAGLGVEYRHQYLRPKALTNAYAEGYDEQGILYSGRHIWTHRVCEMRHVGLNLPVMLGCEFSDVVILAGVKLNADVWGQQKEKGLYSLEATYDRYMDPFEKMPNHGFVKDEPYTCAPVPLTTSFDLRACLEVGYCFHGGESTPRRGRGRSNIVKCYVSAFGEYGVVGSEGAYVPFLIGARLTMLLPLPKGRECTCWKF